jgi:hypothetical protein
VGSRRQQESGSAAAIKTFKNTELGETWVEEGEAPDWQRLVERREDYRIGSVPQGGLLLVGGADVQKDRIEASVWAFGRGKESWLIEHRVLMGDTARDAVWKGAGRDAGRNWTHASGAAMPLARFALDTGFATQEAYAFVRACRDPRVMAVKGVPRGAALIGTPTAIDVSQGGKKLRRGIKVYTVAVGIAKLEFYNNLRKSADVGEDGLTTVFPAGFVHLPKDRRRVHPATLRGAIDHPPRPQRLPGARVAKDARAQRGARLLRLRPRGRIGAGLDRFEERHWRELERQLGLASPPPPIETPTNRSTRPPNAVASLFLATAHRSARDQKPLAVLTSQGENMSLATRIESLVIRVAQEFNDVRAKAGNLANLTTTDKSNLVAAINELKAAVVSSAVIDDAQIAAIDHLLVQQDRLAARRAQGRHPWVVRTPPTTRWSKFSNCCRTAPVVWTRCSPPSTTACASTRRSR